MACKTPISTSTLATPIIHRDMSHRVSESIKRLYLAKN